MELVDKVVPREVERAEGAVSTDHLQEVFVSLSSQAIPADVNLK